MTVVINHRVTTTQTNRYVFLRRHLRFLIFILPAPQLPSIVRLRSLMMVMYIFGSDAPQFMGGADASDRYADPSVEERT